jgi:hypothetical protein
MTPPAHHTDRLWAMAKLGQGRSMLSFALGGCLSIGISYSLLFFDESLFTLFADEDHLFESLTAVFFLIASACFAILYVRDSPGNLLGTIRTKRNIFYVLLAIVFFIGAGEEISWGQRILDVETPELLMRSNMQHEINIHNLAIFHGLEESGERKSFWKLFLNIDRLFSLFWFSYCLLVPIALTLNASFREFIFKLNLPVVPIAIGLLFVANYAASKFATTAYPTVGHYIVEVKEYNFAFLFFLISLYFLTSMRSSAGSDSA